MDLRTAVTHKYTAVKTLEITNTYKTFTSFTSHIFTLAQSKSASVCPHSDGVALRCIMNQMKMDYFKAKLLISYIKST
jgi:hypothetical protein